MIEVDAATGVIHVDDEGLRDLLGAPQRELHEAVASQIASSHLLPAIDALRDPDIALDLVVAGRSVLTHRIGVDGEHAVAVLGVTPGLHQVLALPPSHVPAALVRLTRLRARRLGPREPRPCPPGGLGCLVHADPTTRADALMQVGADFAWRLGVIRGDAQHQVVATDGPAGLFLADPDAQLLRPISDTSAYRIFATVLPAALSLGAD